MVCQITVNRVRLLLAVLLLAALAACGTSNPPAPVTTSHPVPSSTFPAPNPVKIVSLVVGHVADGPRDWFTAEQGDERGNRIPAGSSVISVTLTIRNTLSDPIGLPDGVPIEVQYGPTAVHAEQIAPPRSYRPPHVVPPGGTAMIESLFLMPTDQVIGAVVYVPLQRQAGAPLDTATITKTT